MQLKQWPADVVERRDISTLIPYAKNSRTHSDAQVAQIAASMKAQWSEWNASVEASDAGKDYPEGTVAPNQPGRRFWDEDSAYEPYLDEFKTRPEYGDWMKRKSRAKAKTKGKQG